MLPKLSLYNWWLHVKCILSNESNSPLALALGELFSTYNIFIDVYELDVDVTWIEFIRFMKRYIYNASSNYDSKKCYIESVLKILFAYFESHDNLLFISILEDTMNDIRMNEFALLFEKYNNYLAEEHRAYGSSFMYHERFHVDAYYCLVEDWQTWFKIRKAMSTAFDYTYEINWDIFSTFLHSGEILEWN
jgi:hypothetical protein